MLNVENRFKYKMWYNVKIIAVSCSYFISKSKLDSWNLL